MRISEPGTAKKYGVSVARRCVRYCLQPGAVPLPNAMNPAHRADNARVDFEISDAAMEKLKNARKIQNHGEFSLFPVFGGKTAEDGTCTPGEFPHKA